MKHKDACGVLVIGKHQTIVPYANFVGTAVVGGLFTSTFLTLIDVPVAYSLLDGLHNKLGGGPRPTEIDDMQDEDGPVQAHPEAIPVA
jgi:hypothetical protein